MTDSRTLVEGDLNKPRKGGHGATQLETHSNSTLPSFNSLTPGDAAPSPSDAGKKTQFFRPAVSAAEQQPARKLIGWIYSFSYNPNGVFFALYEGKTSIGSAPSNDIVINDPNISANHCFVLHRATKKTFIKDEASTNGTFVNGEELVGSERLITDSDEIKLANLVFTVRLIKEAMPAPAPATT